MQKYKDQISIALIVVMVIVLGFNIFSSKAQYAEEKKDGININIDVTVNGEKVSASSGEGMIGALGDPSPTNLDTDEWTALNDLVVDDLEVNDDAFVLGDLDIVGSITASGTVNSKELTTTIAKTSIYATTTLLKTDSGTTYLLSASGTTITLPAVAESDGVKFRFVINGASTDGNFLITSAEGDNIEGSIIVAGAVVDCDDADVLTFVTDGENLGDFVEVISDGTNWFPTASGALTASKLTCSG